MFKVLKKILKSKKARKELKAFIRDGEELPMKVNNKGENV